MTEHDEAGVEPVESRFVGTSTLLRSEHPRVNVGSLVCDESGAHRNLTDDEIAAGAVTPDNAAIK